MKKGPRRDKIQRFFDLASVLAMAAIYGYIFWFLTIIGFKILPRQSLSLWLAICEVSAIFLFFGCYMLFVRVGSVGILRKIPPVFPASLLFITIYFVLNALMRDAYFGLDQTRGHLRLVGAARVAFDFAVWNLIAAILASFFFIVNKACILVFSHISRSKRLP